MRVSMLFSRPRYNNTSKEKTSISPTWGRPMDCCGNNVIENSKTKSKGDRIKIPKLEKIPSTY
jgi:hypothetical protein